jgi:riboflavin transporter FmnP
MYTDVAETVGGQTERAKLNTPAIAGTAVFGALAIILTVISQSLGLNFPIIPYLQFDLGELAIVLAFFILGPYPALGASFVEFIELMVYGQQIPIGPLLKLFALLSTVFGLWAGAKLVGRRNGVGFGNLFGSSFLSAAAVRAIVMTIPNYYLIVFLYSVAGIEGFLRGSFSLIGVTLTDANALALILAFTAVFNVLQLLFVMSVSYLVLRVPSFGQIKLGGRPLWFVSLLRAKESPAS